MSSNTGYNNDNNQLGGGGSNSGEIISSKKVCTSCEQNNVDNITEGIESVAVRDMSMCAACGKESNSNDMNTCNKCKSVKYCNAACKKKHRSKHKKACEKRVAELHEEQLFKDPPSPEDCPICFLPLPDGRDLFAFQFCCGKRICAGCDHENSLQFHKRKKGVLCAFCRTPRTFSKEEQIKRLEKLMDNGNAEAFYTLGCQYYEGRNQGSYSKGLGLLQDYQKANELFLKGGELGCADAYLNLGNSYNNGRGVERDMEKATYYWGLAAIKGNVQARYYLGCNELLIGQNSQSPSARTYHYRRGMKHMVISSKAGHKKSFDDITIGYKHGVVQKEDYEMTLRAYHERQKEMKSDARDEAAAFNARASEWEGSDEYWRFVAKMKDNGQL